MNSLLVSLSFILLATNYSFGQPAQILCDRVIAIDTNEYKKNFLSDDPIQSTKRFEKINNKLTILTSKISYSFTDYFENGDFITKYKVVGEDSRRDWVWIEQQGLHSTHYYLINTKTSKIDTLVGPAKIFGDKIVSLEDGYTDSPRQVEIYKITDGKIDRLKRFRLEPCDKICCVRTVYLRDKEIFLSDNSGRKWRAWKAKVF